MLCTFTTNKGQTLIVRSDDIRMIENRGPEESIVLWMIGDAIHDRIIQGTALENAARIQ